MRMQKLACALALAGAVIAGATSVWHVIFGVSQAWLVSGPVLGVLPAALAFAITRAGRAEVPRVLWTVRHLPADPTHDRGLAGGARSGSPLRDAARDPHTVWPSLLGGINGVVLGLLVGAAPLMLDSHGVRWAIAVFGVTSVVAAFACLPFGKVAAPNPVTAVRVAGASMPLASALMLVPLGLVGTAWTIAFVALASGVCVSAALVQVATMRSNSSSAASVWLAARITGLLIGVQLGGIAFQLGGEAGVVGLGLVIGLAALPLFLRGSRWVVADPARPSCGGIVKLGTWFAFENDWLMVAGRVYRLGTGRVVIRAAGKKVAEALVSAPHRTTMHAFRHFVALCLLLGASTDCVNQRRGWFRTGAAWLVRWKAAPQIGSVVRGSNFVITSVPSVGARVSELSWAFYPDRAYGTAPRVSWCTKLAARLRDPQAALWPGIALAAIGVVLWSVLGLGVLVAGLALCARALPARLARTRRLPEMQTGVLTDCALAVISLLASLTAVVAGLAHGSGEIEVMLVVTECGASATWASKRVTASFRRWIVSDRAGWVRAQTIRAATQRAAPLVPRPTAGSRA